ncbi:hypothetical protein [Corynebacterium jeddahense]|uniref:Uncharacterized protein n=1 Tax=Corynebacterium jeddahense TaxID=1414719 RepID=A0ABY7UJE5_9CORY|nr:hypothetical protein [Corynebacterium jeddahense]WCZ38860.1 hypothetical protein CJEDD_06285 [Corynebacterium jeddahense]
MAFARRNHTARRAPGLAVAAAAAAVALAAAGGAPAAQAQLPGGLNPEAVQSMIPSEISVPAGESTTVDVGVPVDVNYAADGWVVSSSGTSVTVTAPDRPGASAAVPASAGGFSTTVNLVAVGAEGTKGAGGAGAKGGAQDAGTQEKSAPDTGTQGSEAGSGAGSGAGTGAGSGAVAVEHPERRQAEHVDTTSAKRLYFDGEIRGNEIVVKVPWSKAKDLMQYANYDKEHATLRYLDVNGNVIEGVKRDIDIAGRTLTLTYPEGETPDNPFIMEVVRDGNAEFIATITATNAPVEQAAADSDYAPRQGERVDAGGSSSRNIVPLMVAGVALLAALALLIALLRRRRRGQVA